MDNVPRAFHPRGVQIIEVTGFAVRSAVIRMRRRDTPLQFVVYPMIHMAKATFYTEVADRLRGAQVIVAEGVRGRRGSALMGALTLSYRILKFNRRAGLVEQNIDYATYGVPVIKPDVDADEFLSSWRRIPVARRALMWCALPLILIARLFGGTRTIWSKAMEQHDLPSDMDERLAEDMPELAEATVGERDRRLLAALRRLHEERGSEAIEVAVVYGAGHVPAVVYGLRQLGYIARFGDWLTIVDLIEPTPAPGSRSPTASPSARPRPTPEPRPAVEPRSASEPERGVDARPEAGAHTGAKVPDPEARLRSREAQVARLRALVERKPDEYSFRLVHALIALSERLVAVRRPHDGLAAADEAVDIAEDLRERFGAIYSDTYAAATYALGERLWDLGRFDEAMTVYAEAADTHRRTYRNDPYKRAQALGRMLADHSGRLRWRGRVAEAVAVAEEAIALLRAASQEAPDDFTHPLAIALRSLAAGLNSLGRLDEALDAAQRSVNLARRLTDRRPERAVTLVDSLHILAQVYRDLGRTDDDLAALRESVEIARAASAKLAPGDRTVLGLALLELANALSVAGRFAEAMGLWTETVELLRAVARADASNLGYLSVSLGRQASVQWSLRADDRGLHAAEEAEAIARDLASTPGPWEHALPSVLGMLWRTFHAVGQSERALAVIDEMIDLQRTADRLDALRRALVDRALLLELLGRVEEAQAARDQASTLGVTSTSDDGHPVASA